MAGRMAHKTKVHEIRLPGHMEEWNIQISFCANINHPSELDIKGDKQHIL